MGNKGKAVLLGVRSACDKKGKKLAAAHTIHLLLTWQA
jgi:hypothetical protein